MKKTFYLIIMLIISFLPTNKLLAQTYPTGFSQQLVASNITKPTCMAFAPDGRLFILEQTGAIKILKNGILLATPFTTFTVNSTGERGLLGLAFDPNFATNRFIYVYYTVSNGANNRLSRITASTANGDVMQAGSEVVLLNFDPLSSATNHNGGFLKFGADGKLYITIGENANSANAPNLDTYHGKMLRVNSDGTAPTDNPFYNVANTAQKNRVWSYGLRNPFSFDVQPSTGKIFINDVGAGTWEEINDASTSGRNFGWPNAEGVSTNVSYTNPVYTYNHSNGCAIVGGTFFNPTSTNYPATYTGNYFFLDYCNGWMDRLVISGGTATRQPFATGLPGSPVCLAVGSDGNIYFTGRTDKKLYRVIYNAGATPSITNHPANLTVQVGQSAAFSVTATGTAPLSYQWRKGTANIGGANGASYTINAVTTNDVGAYNVVVSNASGSATSNDATLTVTAANLSPTAQINTPTMGTSYAGGDAISFSGDGADPENGPVTFEWSVMFHHDVHTHPGPSVTLAGNGKSGSFTIPTQGETASNVFYRLYLTVKDAQNNATTVYRDISPRTSQITLASNPTGLQVTLDGQPVIAPNTTTRVEGVSMTIGTVSPQYRATDGLIYTFTNWSHGGATSQTFGTPVNDATYTANFTSSLRNPDTPTNTTAGLSYKYYEGDWNAVPYFNSLVPVKTGAVSNFNLSERNINDRFGFVFTGFVNIPSDGTYQFFISSDEGSLLYIGDFLVVNNDGLHAALEKSGSIGLKKGLHAIRVEYFDKTGSQSLAVNYAGPTFTKKKIPNNTLFYSTTSPKTATTEPTADGILIYPNPAKFVINILTGDTWSNASVKITDLNGRLITETILSGNETDIETEDLPNGIYLVTLQKGNRISSQRVLVNK